MKNQQNMTIEEIPARKECQTFDCKSIQIDPKALTVPIVAMANADDGVLAIGVSDKTLTAEWTTEKELDRLNTTQVEKLVAVMNDDYVDVSEMMKLCGIVRRKKMQDSYITPALTDGSIERKYSNQPNHPKQMYRLTEKAKSWKKSVIE